MSRTMKDSGIEWIGDVPEEWEVKPIKYIKSKEKNSFADGPFGSNLKSEHFVENGDVLVIESGFITTGKFIYKDFKTITKEHFETIKRSECKAKDIIIAKIGANYGMSGELPLLHKPSVVSGNSLKITLDNKKYLNSIFVFAMMTAKSNKGFLDLVQENAQPALSLSGLNNFKLPSPPLAEQHLIAAFLDKKCSEIDSLIDLQEQMIEELKAYKQSVITEAVTKGIRNEELGVRNYKDSCIEWIGDVPEGWEVKELKYSLDGLCDGTHGTFERVDNGELLLSAKNIGDRGIVLGDNESQISHEDYTRIISNGFPSKGDVLLCCVGSIGKCCIFNEEKPIAFQRSVAFLRHNKTMTSEYLMYLLKSNIMQAQYEMCARKSAQSGIYMGVINNFVIVAPHSINEQQAIADYLDKKCGEIDELIIIKQQKIESLKEYKKSVIYEYVTGKKEP